MLMPSSFNPLHNSTTPDLSETLTSARFTVGIKIYFLSVATIRMNDVGQYINPIRIFLIDYVRSLYLSRVFLQHELYFPAYVS